MAMTARATNIGGTMVAETRNGSRRFHAHDPQGNTVALINDAGAVTDSYDYWPYGEVRVTTGSASSTPFKFGGAWGYYDDGNQLYIRARYLREKLGRWLTRDPLWPLQAAYVYCLGNPRRYIDPSGLDSCPDDKCCCCPAALYFYEEKCYGPGTNNIPQCVPPPIIEPAQAGKDYRGHNLTIFIGVTWMPSDGKSGGGCSIKWTEALFINGQNLSPGDPFTGSVQEMQWKACSFNTSPPANCNQSQFCRITDQPGMTPWGGSPARRVDFVLYERAINIEIFPGPGCSCPPLRRSWDQLIEWSKKGEPIRWTP